MKFPKIKSLENPEPEMHNIADYLMNKCLFQVNVQRYRISELEFYINGNAHPDPYAHQHKRQQTAGEWYFHGSGIDITMGSDEYHGGILLRALMKQSEENQYFYGPLNILTELFSQFGTIKNNSIQFGLVEAKLEKEKIYPAPRVGLSNKSLFYRKKLYRFFIYPSKTHADKTKIVEAIKSSYKQINEVIWG